MLIPSLPIEISLKWLTVTMPLLETSKILERERQERKIETRETLERDETMADGHKF